MQEVKSEDTEDHLRERIKELEQENAALRESNKDLEHFAYVASHDLQSPLRTVEGFLKVIHKEVSTRKTEQLESHFQHVFAGVKRLQVLIHDLLDYSRAGRNVERQSIQSHPLIELTKYELRNLIASFPLTKITTENLPEVFAGHRVSMGQLFKNLMANAIQFADAEKENHIIISATDVGSHWQFQFKDHGLGIAEENQTRIFELFSRLHSRKMDDAGTGIGLALCKRIVEAHGGKIHIESTLEEGSCFTFTLMK